MIRSIGAVLGAYIGMLCAMFAFFGIMHVAAPQLEGPPPSGTFMALNLAVNIVVAFAGGYLAAKLAPANPLAHGVALAVLAEALGIIEAITTWSMRPHWLTLVTLAAAPLAILAGAWYRSRRPQPARASAGAR